VGSSEEGL